MFKPIHIIIIFCLIFPFPSIIHADTNSSGIKVAFVRDGYLWVKVGDMEEKLTAKKASYDYLPQWSHDGSMLLYQKTVPGNIDESEKTSNELWVYDLRTKKHQKIFYDGQNPKWSPTENIVAFSQSGVLNISDLKKFYNIALGVDDFGWQPNGKGFIASSSASMRPDGWTNPVLYTISIEEGYKDIMDLTAHVKKLFTIPTEVGNGNAKILALGAGSFTYSPDEKWLSFIIYPTASWSMDSDMLSVISVDGTEFEVIDEVILNFEPKWASRKNLLGYIAGGGRIVFGFKNKDLKVTELPAYYTESLTPENHAELGFTWVTDGSLIVSRVKESDWSDEPKERPKPSLYYVSLASQKQLKITTPPKDKGDFDPQFLSSIMKITWHRKNDFVELKGDLWLADPNGANAKVWIKDIEIYSLYSPNK
ncbi:TolB domain-containing protein [Sporosarcina sp. Marseille-Q4063]|uniref:TolB domain-containing protein n=1 Tax=Sporosarcina sp. Marseille-Q4063 TaxID=2810514 RepID=UPI001BAFF490|nr:TolB domain-containing protein [Sporosarcina sp. Marseille-Q4063]QUW23542.1 TolB domain-containing protein [Sporosarcina sp. Marseille-Q4063]